MILEFQEHWKNAQVQIIYKRKSIFINMFFSYQQLKVF